MKIIKIDGLEDMEWWVGLFDHPTRFLSMEVHEFERVSQG